MPDHDDGRQNIHMKKMAKPAQPAVTIATSKPWAHDGWAYGVESYFERVS
jgi:hypothetical protein